MLKKTKVMASLAAAIVMGLGAHAAANDQVDAANAVHTELSREQVIDVILGTWDRHLDVEERERMEVLLSSADTTNLRSAMDMLDYDAMIAALNGAPVTDGDDGWKILALGDPDQDLVYTPIAPCRILDTRVASPRGGVIPQATSREFYSWHANFATAQGGHASNCGIPPSPVALAVNVTAVNPGRDGFLTVYPAETTRPLASSLNYSQGTIAGNEVIGVMRQGLGFGFEVYSWGTAHVVADVVGYFMPPLATALQCQNATVNYDVGANTTGVGTVSCPADYTVTGGGCAGALTGPVRSSQPSGNGWFCRTQNTTGTATTNVAHARCCRVPGR